jgi:hypothetical protein
MKPTPNVPELLGLSPICQVSDEDIWNHLITPTVKSLLGEKLIVEPTRLIDTVEGLFPGDQVSNLNGNLLPDETGKLVATKLRFPYLHTLIRTTNGCVVIKRDVLKFQVICWYGSFEKGSAELIFKAALRDRRYDGTKRADDCSLLEYSYANPIHHKRLSTNLSSVELSIYGYMPGSRVSEGDGDFEFENFVRNPFKFLSTPDKFLALFQRAFRGSRATGQFMKVIAAVSDFSMRGFECLAAKHGYDLLEMAASHYHVAKWAQKFHMEFADPQQKKMLDNFAEGLARIRQQGTPLTRSQQSWVIALQSLRPMELIPEPLRILTAETAHLTWPQDNVSEVCLWLYKPLSRQGKRFKPHLSFAAVAKNSTNLSGSTLKTKRGPNVT